MVCFEQEKFYVLINALIIHTKPAKKKQSKNFCGKNTLKQDY